MSISLAIPGELERQSTSQLEGPGQGKEPANGLLRLVLPSPVTGGCEGTDLALTRGWSMATAAEDTFAAQAASTLHEKEPQ